MTAIDTITIHTAKDGRKFRHFVKENGHKGVKYLKEEETMQESIVTTIPCPECHGHGCECCDHTAITTSDYSPDWAPRILLVMGVWAAARFAQGYNYSGKMYKSLLNEKLYVFSVGDEFEITDKEWDLIRSSMSWAFDSSPNEEEANTMTTPKNTETGPICGKCRKAGITPFHHATVDDIFACNNRERKVQPKQSQQQQSTTSGSHKPDGSQFFSDKKIDFETRRQASLKLAKQLSGDPTVITESIHAGIDKNHNPFVTWNNK